MMRHRLAALALGLVCGAGACKQDAVTLVDTTVRGAGGAAVGVIPAFSRVKVRAVPFMDDGWIRVVDGPLTGEAREAQVGILPLPTTTAWVLAIDTELRGSQTTRRIGGCTAVSGLAVKSDDEAHFVVVEQGQPVGTLRQADVSMTKPGAEIFWAPTVSSLKDLGARAAAVGAEATLTCDPRHVAAREVLAALLDRDDPGRAAELLTHRQTPPSPLPVVASGAVLTSGMVAFVGVTDESLRSEPRADGPVVVALPIGTSVRVLEVTGAFAKVQSLAGDLVVEITDPFADAADTVDDGEDHEGGEGEGEGNDPGDAVGRPDAAATPAPVPTAPTPAPAGQDPFASAVRDVLRVGFVPAASLFPAAPDRARLEAEATALGASAEAVVLRQRALALEPGRDQLRKALVDVALQANRPREAALALHTPVRQPGGAQMVADMTTLRGCSGDIRRATISDGETVALDRVEGDLCVDFDPRPTCLDRQCPDEYADPDCDCGEDDHEHEGDTEDAGPEKPAAVVEAEAAAVRARDEATAAEAAADLAREQAEAAEARIELVSANEAKKARAARLDELMPRGPFVRLSLRRLAALPPGTTLHLARLQVTQDCSDNGAQLEDIHATFARQPLPLPTPRPQGEFVVFFEALPGFTYALYRVAPGEPGPDSGELAERREARIAEVLVPDAEPDCSCTPWCWR